MISAKPMTEEDLNEVLDNALSPDTPYIDRNDRSLLLAAPDGITLWRGDEIIAICGIHWFWGGVGEAWIILHRNAHKYRFASYRATKKIYNIVREGHDGGWKRIQATVRVDWPEAIKMCEKCGFHREGRLEAYSPDGTDVYMYAMVQK